jgi:hypothetical protein
MLFRTEQRTTVSQWPDKDIFNDNQKFMPEKKIHLHLVWRGLFPLISGTFTKQNWDINGLLRRTIIYTYKTLINFDISECNDSICHHLDRKVNR